MPLTERNIDFRGIRVHGWEGGQGFPILMLHGSGPGVSAQANFRLILEPLAANYHILALDLIGFGGSGRKSAPPFFDLDLWLQQAQAAIDVIPEKAVGVIGHSISATLALRLAAANPRITKVLTTGAMGARFAANADTVLTWTFPETREELRRVGKALVYDQRLIDDNFLDGRMKILGDPEYAAYFRSMFAGDKQAIVDAANLGADTLAKIACDVVMVHGKDDRPFPYAETTMALARQIPQADAVVLARCGHSPALEHPDKLVQIARMLFG